MPENSSPEAAPMLTLELDKLESAVGTALGPTGWTVIDQERINLFADATGDHQWIHVDAERAAAGPFGTTIAHGYLTLSLVPLLIHEAFEVKPVSLVINYGLNRLRFTNPVPSGSRVRLAGEISAVDPFNGGVQATVALRIEIEGKEKPAVIAENIYRYYR
ncbi:MAG: MaoC family dehydratase [Acidimicrobiia bacterium]